MVTGKDILKSDGEAMADVEITVSVWWWHNDGIVVSLFVFCWSKCAGFFPESVDFWLVLVRFVSFAEFHKDYYIISGICFGAIL